MRIVVDVTPLSFRRTGIGNYLRGMLVGMSQAEATVVAFALAGPRRRRVLEHALDGLAVERRIVLVPPSAHTLRTAWSRLGRISVERLAGPLDAFHFSDWMFPPQRRGVRATTVFDVIPVHFPEWVPARTMRMHRRKYAHAARTCDVVYAISEFSADDVAATLAIARERVRVAYPGVDAHFTPEGERTDLGTPYVLAVSTLEPRKNLPVLLDAFATVRRRRPELQLALAGAAGWGERPELAQPGVRPLGYVRDEDLPALYRGAACFVYPSRYEGFGMPIVEALACGTPVVASAHPSLDEASGGIALRAEADSAAAFAEEIERALADAYDAGPGLEHARRFTWKACADAVLAGYAAAAERAAAEAAL